MVPFWIPILIRHIIFRVPKKGTKILTSAHLLEYLAGSSSPAGQRLGSRGLRLRFRIGCWGFRRGCGVERWGLPGLLRTGVEAHRRL